VVGGHTYTVGEYGPQKFTAGADGMMSDGGGITINGDVVIRANSEAEGRAAARGFSDEMKQILRHRG